MLYSSAPIKFLFQPAPPTPGVFTLACATHYTRYSGQVDQAEENRLSLTAVLILSKGQSLQPDFRHAYDLLI